MGDYDARLELAPRDVVARAIQDQMVARGEANVLLDISHCQRDHVLTHFPNIAAQCLQQGIDITADPIPVAPAAHYMCGGVQVTHGSPVAPPPAAWKLCAALSKGAVITFKTIKIVVAPGRNLRIYPDH